MLPLEDANTAVKEKIKVYFKIEDFCANSNKVLWISQSSLVQSEKTRRPQKV